MDSMITRPASVLLAGALCVLAWSGHVRARGTAPPPNAAVQQQATTDSSPENTHLTVLRRYCVGCHNQRTQTAGLALDTVDLTGVGEHAELCGNRWFASCAPG